MSVMAQRRIVDFAEEGLALAKAGPGELNEGMEALIERLHEEGLLRELVAQEWIKRTFAYDKGRVPKPRGCNLGLGRILGWWWR